MTVIGSTLPCVVGEAIALYAEGETEPDGRALIIKPATIEDFRAEWGQDPPFRANYFYFASLD